MKSKLGLRGGLALASTLLGAIVPATAQDAPTGDIKVGFILPAADPNDPLQSALVRGATQGATMAAQEFGDNAALFDLVFQVNMETATGPDEVVVAAQRLVNDDGAFAIVGGYSLAEATALGQWAAGEGVPFFNVGAPSDSLRNDACAATTFHIQPSAAMYLDAIAGWYVRAGLRNWYFVQSDDAEGTAQYDRLRYALEVNHFAAREAGRVAIGPDDSLEDLARTIARSNADLVVLLLDPDAQIAAVSAMESAGVGAMVTGFPWPETQTRDYFAALRTAAPTLGAQFRATAWEATLDAYGAREVNARYRDQFGEPMSSSAWAAYQGINILYTAALFGGVTNGQDVVAYLVNQNNVFDLWKGIGASFRPWDRQLRQPLYLVKITDTATDPLDLGLLVGELPAIYLPGTDPVERLDQLGDLAARSRCGS